MSNIIITTMAPGELFAHALSNARIASNQIDALTQGELTADETPHQRAMQIVRHAMVLSEAFAIIDSLADIAGGAEDPAPEPELERTDTATPPHMN